MPYKRAFTWLPFVDNCCGCVDNLRVAVYIISSYGVVQFFSTIIMLVFPQCTNLHSSKGLVSTFLKGWEVVFYIGATGLFLTSLLMGLSTLVNKPLVKPFIISTYVFCTISLINTIVFILQMASLNSVCEQENYNRSKFRLYPFHYCIKVSVDVLVAMLMVYYTVVVNSYASLWDQYGGNIPDPEPPPPIHITYTIPRPPGNAPQPGYPPPPGYPPLTEYPQLPPPQVYPQQPPPTGYPQQGSPQSKKP